MATNKDFIVKNGIKTGGPVTLPADPTNALEAATKQYVDNKPAGSADWNTLQNKPATFTPSTHTHDAGALPSRSDWSTRGGVVGVVGQVVWRNYGSGHTIFDASASVTPTGTGCSNTNPTNGWTGTYPTLMGFNGVDTYGVRVDRARYAEEATGNLLTALNAKSASGHAHTAAYWQQVWSGDSAGSIDLAGTWGQGKFLIHAGTGVYLRYSVMLSDTNEDILLHYQLNSGTGYYDWFYGASPINRGYVSYARRLTTNNNAATRIKTIWKEYINA